MNRKEKGQKEEDCNNNKKRVERHYNDYRKSD
jgi:hypothetical protein